MINKSKINKIKYYFLKIFQLQLFLSIISLAILIIWGLPISLLSPIGNIVFGPVLSVFLLLSSLIFFLELFGLPNTWLIKSLDTLTNIWLKLLSFGTDKALVTFACNSTISIFFLVIGALLVLHLKKINLKKRIVLLSCVLLTFCIFSKINVSNDLQERVNIEGKEFFIILKNSKINIIDENHILSNRVISGSYIEYTFIPFFIKKYGHSNIDNIFLNYSNRSFNAVKVLAQKTKINHLYFSNYKKFKLPDFNTVNELKGIKIHSIEKYNNKTCSNLI